MSVTSLFSVLSGESVTLGAVEHFSNYLPAWSKSRNQKALPSPRVGRSRSIRRRHVKRPRSVSRRGRARERREGSGRHYRDAFSIGREEYRNIMGDRFMTKDVKPQTRHNGKKMQRDVVPSNSSDASTTINYLYRKSEKVIRYPLLSERPNNDAENLCAQSEIPAAQKNGQREKPKKKKNPKEKSFMEKFQTIVFGTRRSKQAKLSDRIALMERQLAYYKAKLDAMKNNRKFRSSSPFLHDLRVALFGVGRQQKTKKVVKKTTKNDTKMEANDNSNLDDSISNELNKLALKDKNHMKFEESTAVINHSPGNNDHEDFGTNQPTKRMYKRLSPTFDASEIRFIRPQSIIDVVIELRDRENLILNIMVESLIAKFHGMREVHLEIESTPLTGLEKEVCKNMVLTYAVAIVSVFPSEEVKTLMLAELILSLSCKMRCYMLENVTFGNVYDILNEEDVKSTIERIRNSGTFAECDIYSDLKFAYLKTKELFDEKLKNANEPQSPTNI